MCVRTLLKVFLTRLGLIIYLYLAVPEIVKSNKPAIYHVNLESLRLRSDLKHEK